MFKGTAKNYMHCGQNINQWFCLNHCLSNYPEVLSKFFAQGLPVVGGAKYAMQYDEGFPFSKCSKVQLHF